MSDKCKHEDFRADVAVGRLSSVEGGPTTSYVADITVVCAECHEPFVWLGPALGLSPREPRVSLDGTELHAPLRPASAPAGWGETGAGFDVTIRDETRPDPRSN